MKIVWTLSFFVFAFFLGRSVSHDTYTKKETVMFAAMFVMTGILSIKRDKE